MLGKLFRLFSRYPTEPGVHPRSFADLTTWGQAQGPARRTVAFQSVPDKFYFLIFGAIVARLKQHASDWRAELLIVRSLNGGVGSGWSAELKRAAPVSWLHSGGWVRAYAGLVDGVGYRCSTWAHPLRNLADWQRSRTLWLEMQHQSPSGTYSLLVDGVEVADLVISSYLRFKPAPAFDVADPFVRRIVWQALRDVRQANAYFRETKPKLYLTSYTTYLEHGIPARVALRHGVATWSFGNLNRFGKQLSLADPYQTVNFTRYRSTFESLDHQADKLEQARAQLAHRLSGGIDAATSYMRQSAYGKTGVALPPGLNGAAVVFLHDFYDSPHVYPDLVFDDFWRWICFTIEELQRSGARFFLKPHPNQIALSDEALGQLRQKYPGLDWLPDGISNVQLAEAGIACGVTVYGTVAHELAYLGVPSIGSARHPHHTFDFCRTARTRDEYAGMLKTYTQQPMPKAEMQRQALAFYYMHNLYGNDDERALQQAFVEFWKACNVGAMTEEAVLCGFRQLVDLPAFDRFIATLADSGMSTESTGDTYRRATPA